MKIHWNLLVISVLIGAISAGLVYVVMALHTQGIFPISFPIIFSILIFCGLTLTIGIYFPPFERKTKKEVVVGTIKGETKLRWKPLLILLLITIALGLILSFGQDSLPKWFAVPLTCIYAFCFLFLIVGWFVFFKKKEK
jgi:hypothetical protein